jgi:energy-coupling factor transport system ATP-binding protein
MPAIIKLENVTWTYSHEQKSALRDISLEIEEGSFIAVMGGNGAGKSSFCRLLNGLIPHSLEGKLSGKVTVDGDDTRSLSVASFAKKVGMAFDDAATQLFTAKVYDEVSFALENLLLEREDIAVRVKQALETSGLWDYRDYPVSCLSGGQKQRLTIAAALAMAEKIIVLDEPTSQLDPLGAKEVLSFIRELRAKKGLTVVMATGSVEEAAEFAEKTIVLREGSLAALGTPKDIFSDKELLASCMIEPPQASRFARGMEERGQPTTEAIRIRSLSHWYEPGRIILEGINLSVAEGEFAVIIGQNGSGKTTLMKNISGLLRPRQGEIFIRGKNTAAMDITEIAKEAGYVAQDPDNQLFEQTVFDEAAFSLKRTGSKKEISEKVDEALETVGLLDKKDAFPPALSRTDRIKTVLAAVLAMNTGILLLDEPLAGQDSSRVIMDIIAKLRQKGKTILMITHNINIAAQCADRIIVMKNARIATDVAPPETFTPDELASMLV